MVFKIVYKSLKKSKSLLFSVFLLFTLATMLLSLSTLTFNNLEKNYENKIDELSYEDYRFFTIAPLQSSYDENFEKSFEEKFNSKIEKHLYYIVDTKSMDYSINRFDDYTINKIDLVEGKLPLNKNEILITPRTAKLNNLKIGDNYNLDETNYKISAIGFIPQYTQTLDLSTGVGSIDGSTFEAVYLNKEDYDNLTYNKDTEFMYYSAKFNSEVTDEKKTYDSMTKNFYEQIPVLDEYNNPVLDENLNLVTKDVDLVTFVMDDKMNFPLTGLESEITGDKTMFKVLSAVVTSIAILLTIVLLNNIFKTQKREMGILKAEGISNSELGSRFTFLLTLIITASSIIGLSIAYFASSRLAQLILTLYEFENSPLSNDVILLTIKNLIIVILTVVIILYFIAIRRNLNKKVLHLVKNISNEKPPKYSFNFLKNSMSFKTKYQFNILIRNFSTTLILAFGVFISSFMLLMGVTMYSAVTSMVEQTYNEVFTYKYEMDYKNNKDYKQNNYSLLKETIDVVESTSKNKLEDNSTAVIFAFDSNNNQYINLKNSKNKDINLKDGIAISKIASIYLKVDIGDTLTIKNPYNNENVELKINDITSDGNSINLYADIDYIQNLFKVDNNFVTGEVSVTKPDEKNYEKVISIEDSTKDLEKIIQVSSIVIGVISLFSMTISFITLVTISFIVINNNKKIISVMKVLGYSTSEITKMTTSSYKWIVIIVYFSSIPLFALIIQKIIDTAMKDMDFAFSININMYASVSAFILIYITYLISMTIAKRQISKIKLSESLKTDE